MVTEGMLLTVLRVQIGNMEEDAIMAAEDE